MAIHILGIRHHGPGSAKNVLSFLESVKPDIVLIEGPPEADEILQWAHHAALKPPVAILCYQPDDPEQSSFYPFASFSPEWQAMVYAGKNKIHCRFMDLPAGQQFAIEKEKRKAQVEMAALPEENISAPNETTSKDTIDTVIRIDPTTWLANAAGYTDAEKWWEHMFEHRKNSFEVFTAVNEAMQVLREHFPSKDNRLEQLREAHMRKMIRQAENEMFQNIVVVCGAWHAPALLQMPKQKEDNDLLKGLPKTKVACTWIPWTNDRLSYFSGYGAGIASPGWYEHIWQHPDDNGTLWMAKLAMLFRSKQLDTSVAHVIEAVRLANALAALRNLSRAGLEELNEATLSVLCNGENIMMDLVHNELIVNHRIGEVPESIPKPPLQLDIEKFQKKLKLNLTADWKDYTLDLRKDTDLERSVFLHRLLLLDIKWGQKSIVSGKGTFKEQWRLQWDPAFSVEIIEKGSWGNTCEEAASKYVIKQAREAVSLPVVSLLLENTLPAELPVAVDALINQINNLAAASGDVMQLMEVIPNLVTISRYGNVRKTDAQLVLNILTGMITRICVSLPPACTSIDEDAAQILLELFQKMNDAVTLLQIESIQCDWVQTLSVIAQSRNSSPVIGGYSTRLLFDYKKITGEDLVKAFYYAMSNAPSIAAAWLEGFLKGSGTLLLLDNNLWELINSWVEQLNEDHFIIVLPLLRRTFSNFSKPERRKLGEKVKSGGNNIITTSGLMEVDVERAKKGIAVVMEILGYKN
jgi:hypothetical protein